MDGMIVLNKPAGMTSARAVDCVRRVTNQRKSGHAGTLDPTATGVLLVCLGRGTKLVEGLMDLPKVYRAVARLDVTSEGHDTEGVLSPFHVPEPPSQAAVAAVIPEFEGVIQQIPPALSAVKIAGRPAYKLSRRGRPPKLEPRPVQVYWLRVRRYEWPMLEFTVACGRGTYIRSLIRDLGVRLGTGGCLTALTRTAVGPFRLSEAVEVVQLQHDTEPTARLMSIETARERIAAARDAPPPDPATEP